MLFGRRLRRRMHHFDSSSRRPTAPEGSASRGTSTTASRGESPNVRVRVESVDANGMVTAAASGWVVGDVKAGGRGYFYVPVSTPAATYRASVQAFDKVLLEAPPLQAP